MNTQNEKTPSSAELLKEKHYRDLQRRNIIRLVLTYLAPLILLIVYFQFQYGNLLSESSALHKKSIAESQSNLLDLFLRERVVNMINIIDDPNFKIPPKSDELHAYLKKLKRDSEAFIDLDFFDSTGTRLVFDSPIPNIQRKDYSSEAWYINLKAKEKRFIITDIYMGHRNKPHFTIAVNRYIDGKYIVLRSTLDPEKIYEYMTKNQVARDVSVSIVNKNGYYQLVNPKHGKVLRFSSIKPPSESGIGTAKIKLKLRKIEFAYSWLAGTDWAVIVRTTASEEKEFFGFQTNIIAVSLIIIVILFSIIVTRAKKMVKIEQEKDIATEEKDIAKSQLEHASKLASVGELASGIAHEINNPLAIVASEVGLIKDIMDPAFNINAKFEDIIPHLDHIHDAAFRCRDITRKLLSFVRQDEFKLQEWDVHDIIGDIVDGFFEHEMAVSNIEVVKNYSDSIPKIITDANQLKQVLMNLINNAKDAITPPGKITISTSLNNSFIKISVSDTGKGITKEEMEKIFLPFYTTKEVGKGTGLGLSVSYGIIKNLGGKIEAESISGVGSMFSIFLPVNS